MYFLFKNEKYIKYYTYNHENNIIYDENNIPLKKNHIMYKILEKYKDMLHYLTEVKIIPYNSIEEADNGLIYKGYDKKKKLQYKYGNNYVLKRKSKIFLNFLKIYDKMDQIQKIIEEGLEEKKFNKKFIFASILFLELVYYIRLGKEIYLTENETVGILTLKKKNLIKDENKSKFTIKFIAKTGKEQIFECFENNQPILYNLLNKLYINTQDKEDFIFVDEKNQRFTERMLNFKLNKIGVCFKDFRTYGVNMVLLKELYSNLIKHNTNILNQKELQKIIQTSIKNTAEIIGHGKNVAKSSYIIKEIEEILFLYITELDLSNEKNFIKFFIKKLKQ